MTEDNGDHLFVPAAGKWLASGTDDDDDNRKYTDEKYSSIKKKPNTGCRDNKNNALYLHATRLAVFTEFVGIGFLVLLHPSIHLFPLHLFFSGTKRCLMGKEYIHSCYNSVMLLLLQ